MKKGVSVLTLGIVIIILSLITATVTISVVTSAENLNKTKFVTEFILLENRVQDYFTMNDVYPVLEETIELKYEAGTSILQFEGETIENNKILLYKLDTLTLGFDELLFGSGETNTDYYAVSTVTGKLYYVQGFEYEDNVYYRVTQELESNYE